jgi:CelD/BcsL family acetyltransferase involved in cellulose biosynthesis/predicted ATP-grasp superfamily ATP-dependent carboligase
LTALILDASARQALVAVRELGRAGVRVIAADTAPGAPAFASRWCAAHAILPGFEDDPDAFVDAVLALCAEHAVEVVVPCHDGAIAAIRARRERFAGVAAVALAGDAALAVAVDKHRTLEVAAGLGIDVPVGAMVSSPAEVDAVLERTGLPVVVKPSQSWVGEGASRPRLGATLARDRGEALAAVADITGTGTEAAVQRYLPGERLAISFVYAEGTFWARFAQRADRMLPVVGGSSVMRVGIPLPDDATGAAERLVAALNLDGYCEVEFRRDADGRPVLMEINPRLSASVEIATRSGIPFPSLIYDHAAGRPLHEAGAYRPGRRMRWLGGDVFWLAQTLTEAGSHPDVLPATAALATFFGDFFRRTGYDYLDRSDLAPVRAAALASLRRFPQRLVNSVRRRRRREAPVPALPVTIEPLTDPGAVAGEWRALEAGTGSPPYLSWDWLSAWLEVYRPRDPAVVRIGEPAIALGLIERRGPRWHFAGLPVTPVRGLLVAEGDAHRAWDALAGELGRRRGRWGSLSYASVSAEAAALPGARLWPSSSWAVRLPASFDEFIAARSSAQRKAHKQKLRRMDKAGGEVVLLDPAEHADGLAAFLELHTRRAAEKGEHHPQMNADLGALLVRLGAAEGAALRVFELRVAGARAGVSVRIDRPDGGGAWFYNAGFDPDHGQLGPGVVLELESIRDAIARGHHRFDLGPGYWRYKTDLGGEEEALFDGEAFCPSLGGQALLVATVVGRRLHRRGPERLLRRAASWRASSRAG